MIQLMKNRTQYLMAPVAVVLTVLAAGLSGCSKNVLGSIDDSKYITASKPAEAAPAPSAPAPQAEARVEEPSQPREPFFDRPTGPRDEVRVAEPEAAPPAPSVSEQVVSAPTTAAPAPPAPATSALTGLADVFFDYDKFNIRSDAAPVLDANARLLKAESGWKLTIAGHCDERGTSAYNLVLGERRAQAAKKYLEDLGVSGSQIQVTSYGKERPFCTEHNQDCWQMNRRAHLTAQ